MSAPRRSMVKLGLLMAIILAGVAAASLTPLRGYLGADGALRLVAWLREAPAAPLVYVAIYSLATAVAMPGSVLTLAGGAIFGLAGGTLYTTIGANIGANAAFATARFLGRDGVHRLAGSRLQALDRVSENHGFRGMLTLRLIPVVPFNALNFGSGLTAISWPAYASATAIGIFPGTVIYTFFADALLTGSQTASRDALLRVLLAGGLLLLLSFLPAIGKRLGVRIPGSAALLLALVLPTSVTAQALPTHDSFTRVLSEVVRQPRVDYAALADRAPELDRYLAELAATSPGALEAATRDELLAFWINAYNACMLRLVVDHYPIRKADGLWARISNSVAGRPNNSVWQIRDVFTGAHCEVAGQERSQDEIEHEIIRPMGEPRIHFAVNCAAISCPVLWPEAYTAAELDDQLDRAVDRLMANEEHFLLLDGSLRLNRVLDWFRDDFGGISGIRAFLADRLPPDLAQVVLDPETDIDFFEYDWTLNDVAR